MVVRDIERDDIEYISKTLNCLPIAHVDHMKPEKLGHADSVQEMQVPSHQSRSADYAVYTTNLCTMSVAFNCSLAHRHE